MFIEWGFLLGEIWVLLVLAALLGLIAGWIIWGGQNTQASMDADEVQRLRLALEKERARARASVTQSSPVVMPVAGEGYVRPAKAQAAMPVAAAAPASEPVRSLVSDPKPVATQPEPASDLPPPPAPEPAVSADPVPVPVPAAPQGDKPAALTGPQDGIPDDLTKIKGIGKKLERMCNDLGFYHYEQIAAWTHAEVAWVDANLADFKGRVTRDNWVDQAKDLAGDIPPAFVRRPTDR